jgi:hypothetical protein
VDGRHKAGHDDQRGLERVANERRLGFQDRWLPDIRFTIVMAGLVPAIHEFLPSRTP